MCRLTAYKGKSIFIGTLVTHPNNSLICQARDAAYHPGVKDETGRRNIVVNGDGFGVAWYNPEFNERGSCCFKFVTPAWSNQNLQNIGEHVRSSLIFAHIRAATSGHNRFEIPSVSQENCHPFTFGKFTFMHNGGIPYFSKVKLKLLNLLAEPFFHEIKGSTDSEHLFALFLTILYANYRGPGGTAPTTTTAATPEAAAEGGEKIFIDNTVEDMIQALNQTISTVIYLCAHAEIEEPCSINICVTDGVNIIATRYRNGPQNPPSLYYNYGSDFVCENGVFHAKGEAGKKPNDIVISSAPLSRVNEHPEAGDYVECADCEGTLGTESTDSVRLNAVNEEDVGSWILMPKDYMLICRGDPQNLFTVSSVELKPVLVTEPFPGYEVIQARRNKANEQKQQQQKQRANSKVNNNQKNEASKEDSSAGYFPRLSAFLSKKPKIMKFRSKL